MLGLFVKHQNFGHIAFLTKWNFYCQKWKFWSKIQVMIKNKSLDKNPNVEQTK